MPLKSIVVAAMAAISALLVLLVHAVLISAKHRSKSPVNSCGVLTAARCPRIEHAERL